MCAIPSLHWPARPGHRSGRFAPPPANPPTRLEQLDYIGVKRFGADGNPVGEFRIVGLFTSTAYVRSTRAIPYLRRKADAVLRRAGFDPASHSGKALANVLETYPRDELFRIDEDTLYEFALMIQQLDERPRIRVLARRDRFDRFVSILVYVPRDRYDSSVRRRIGEYFAQVFKGYIEQQLLSFFPDGPLTRIHFIIGRSEGETPNPERAALEDAIAGIVRTWTDALAQALAEAHEPSRARALFERYRDAFWQGLSRGVLTQLDAVADIRVIEGLSAERPLGVDFYHRASDRQAVVGLKVLSHRRPIPLSERVPVLENMGFRVVDERTFHVAAAAWAANRRPPSPPRRGRSARPPRIFHVLRRPARVPSTAVGRRWLSTFSPTTACPSERGGGARRPAGAPRTGPRSRGCRRPRRPRRENLAIAPARTRRDSARQRPRPRRLMRFGQRLRQRSSQVRTRCRRSRPPAPPAPGSASRPPTRR